MVWRKKPLFFPKAFVYKLLPPAPPRRAEAHSNLDLYVGKKRCFLRLLLLTITMLSTHFLLI